MRIAFLCSPAVDVWTHRTVERGLRGSEEAVVHMATTLACRGHQSSVYNTARSTTEWFDKVEYGGYDALWRMPVDVCIVWRRPGLLTRSRGASIGGAYLWLRDVVVQDNVIEPAHRYRKVKVLSRFHREFRYRPSREPLLVIYGSNYARQSPGTPTTEIENVSKNIVFEPWETGCRRTVFRTSTAFAAQAVRRGRHARST